jgi:hypothetical protein
MPFSSLSGIFFARRPGAGRAGKLLYDLAGAPRHDF